MSTELSTKTVDVFYTTSNNTVALQLRQDGQACDAVDNDYTQNNDVPDILIENSQIARSQLMGTQNFDGLAEKSDDGTTTDKNCVIELDSDELDDVSVTNPFYISLDRAQNDNLAVAASNSDHDVWVHYFKGEPHDRMVRITHAQSGEQEDLEETHQIHQNSSIAAYYNEENEERRVIFQCASNNTFYDYDTVDLGNTQHLIYTDDARPGTQMAVAAFDGTVHLYYTNGAQELRVVSKQNGANKWGSPKTVNGNAVDVDSRLTIAMDGESNHIFYVARGDSEYTISHVVHKR